MQNTQLFSQKEIYNTFKLYKNCNGKEIGSTREAKGDLLALLFLKNQKNQFYLVPIVNQKMENIITQLKGLRLNKTDLVVAI